jgi:hypothetical protein
MWLPLPAAGELRKMVARRRISFATAELLGGNSRRN